MVAIEDCQKSIFRLAIKHGVSPKLIATRLLSKEDKNDMVNGVLTLDALELAVTLWKEQGMPDYANGSKSAYKPKSDVPMQRYRGIGKIDS